MDNAHSGEESLPAHVQIPTDGTDVWEIDFRLLKFESKVASGSYGDLYVFLSNQLIYLLLTFLFISLALCFLFQLPRDLL